MKNTLRQYDLLYIGEHKSCGHYMADVGTGWIYQELDSGKWQTYKSIRNNHLLFFLEGSCKISYGQFVDREFHAGEMVLVPRMTSVKGATTAPLKYVDMAFMTPMSGCDNLIFPAYRPICNLLTYDFQAVRIRYPLISFLELLVCCLKSGLNCTRLYEIKQKEAFLYLRGFYTKEEIATLFYPIIMQPFDFQVFINENAAKCTSLSQLVKMSNMSRRNFYRKFKATFGEKPRAWMLKQICQRILHEASRPNTTIKDIVTKFDFASPSTFARFCKTNFQCTPTQLMEKCRQNIQG